MLRRSLWCWLALLPLLLLDLFPFVVMLSTAMRPAVQAGASDGGSVLSRVSANISGMWNDLGFGSALLNSFQVAFLSSACSLAIAIPAAYALSRHRFRFRRSFGDLLLVTQVVSPLVLVLGLSQVVTWLRLANSLGALVLLYAAFQVAFAVWLLRGYFDAIPKDIEEAAWLDGASSLRVLWSIVLPLSLPAIAVTGLVGFIAAWNEFALALTILRSQRNYTLSVQVYSLVAGRYEVHWGEVMTAVFVASMPVAILFALLHRALLRGLRFGVSQQ